MASGFVRQCQQQTCPTCPGTAGFPTPAPGTACKTPALGRPGDAGQGQQSPGNPGNSGIPGSSLLSWLPAHPSSPLCPPLTHPRLSCPAKSRGRDAQPCPAPGKPLRGDPGVMNSLFQGRRNAISLSLLLFIPLLMEGCFFQEPPAGTARRMLCWTKSSGRKR